MVSDSALRVVLEELWAWLASFLFRVVLPFVVDLDALFRNSGAAGLF